MKLIEIKSLLVELAKERPIFHSEADFQLALGWKIKERYPDVQIRMEKRIDVDGAGMYVDIIAYQGQETCFMELKYKTKGMKVDFQGEQYSLRQHGAQPVNRHEILKDLQRLETCVFNHPNSYGYLVFLTNDMSYVREGAKPNAIDREFKLHHGCLLTGTLRWGESAGEGTTKGKEAPIVLRNRYGVEWQPYSKMPGGCEFMGMVLRVDGVSSRWSKEEGVNQ